MGTDSRPNSTPVMLPRPNRLMLLALKAPRLIYHLNLSWIFGHRLLLLTHQGRKTALIHQTPLEVVRYDPSTKTSIVISAWGEKSDWYRNILKRPALQIQTARDRYVPEQRVLTVEETEKELATYAEHHRLSAKMLSRIIGIDFAESPVARRHFAESARMIAFHPRSAASR